MFFARPASPRSLGALVAAALLALLSVAALGVPSAHAATHHATRHRAKKHHAKRAKRTKRARTTRTAATARAAAALPLQGLYEECAPSNQQQCAAELSQMGGAGFHVVVNYTAWYGDTAQIQAYAAEAQAAGVKVIWPLNFSGWRDPGSASSLPHEYYDLSPDCACATNAAFLQYAINLVKSLLATWGYYIGDELDPSQAPETAALAAAVRAVDPGHPLLYMGMGGAQTVGNLQPFESLADTVGADIYPVGEGAPVSAVGSVASQVKGLSATAHNRPAMALQAFDWSEYPGEIAAVNPTFPSESQMLQMRNLALTADPSMILWYSLKDIQKSSDPAGNWANLVSAAFAPAPAPAGSTTPRAVATKARTSRRRRSARA